MATEAHEERLLRWPEVEALTSLSKAGRYRRIRHGLFPSAVQLGGRRVAWRLSDVQHWMRGLPETGGLHRSIEEDA